MRLWYIFIKNLYVYEETDWMLISTVQLFFLENTLFEFLSDLLNAESMPAKGFFPNFVPQTYFYEVSD